MKVRWLVVAAGGAVIIVALALSVRVLVAYRAGPARRLGQPIPVETALVERRQIPDSIGAAAVYRASSETTISAEIPATIEAVHVRAADRVRRGQLLIALDRQDLEADLRVRRREVEVARRQLALTAAPPRPEAIREAELRLEQARQKQRSADQSLERVRALHRERVAVAEDKLRLAAAPTDKEKVAQARIDVQAAERAVAAAELDLRRKRTLLSMKLIAGVVAEKAKKNLEDAEGRRDAAREQLRLLERGPLPEAVAVARRAVTEAKAARDREVADAEEAVKQAAAAVNVAAEGVRVARLGPRPEAIATARAALRAAQTRADAAEAQLRKTRIYSPVDGIVMNMDAEPGEVTGQTLSERRALMTLGVINPIFATARVDETQLRAVGIGQAATLTVDAFPSLKLTGKVAYIEAQVDRSTRTFQVVITAPNPGLELRPNLSGFARLSRPREALVVPTVAVLPGKKMAFRGIVFKELFVHGIDERRNDRRQQFGRSGNRVDVVLVEADKLRDPLESVL